MCALYTGDRDKVVFLYESGTYASVSGTGWWPGYVQDHSIDETQDRALIRYQGSDSRDVQLSPQTVIDVAGTLSFYPVDFRFLGFALGSIVDSGSPTPSTHVLSETIGAAGNAFTSGVTAPFMSFQLEDSKQNTTAGTNFIRTVRGAMVDEMTITASAGDPIMCEVKYKAQSVVFSSGATTAVTASTNRPYLWSDSTIGIPSGTIFAEVTDWSLNIKNNIEAPHYCNGSRVVGLPRELNRDYVFTMTYQANSPRSKTLYDQYFQGGSDFNMIIGLNASAGSQTMALTLSGCQVFPLDMTGPVEGIVEQTVTIIPKSAIATATDLVLKYNPW